MRSLSLIEASLANRHASPSRINLIARFAVEPTNMPSIAPAPPRNSGTRAEDPNDGQATGSSSEDQEESQRRREKRRKDQAERSKKAAEDGTPIGSPGSEPGRAIGPMGETENVVGVLGRNSASGMDAFKNGLRKEMRKMGRATAEALSGFVGR